MLMTQCGALSYACFQLGVSTLGREQYAAVIIY